MQEKLARQKEDMAQMHTRQTELQLAAVEREAAAQDLWVRLEAARKDLSAEREQGSQCAVQLGAAQQQIQVCIRLPLNIGVVRHPGNPPAWRNSTGKPLGHHSGGSMCQRYAAHEVSGTLAVMHLATCRPCRLYRKLSVESDS